ncbi:hypothetical protein NDU88_004993 [Pleurodeles waltl]|uniref:Uncharacterized protein n=1 Tax=Pleurodeles waltl TaxID=8319 RepID=A0AAV7MV34_PLEWA|nr:hypothetical protein NDU88_004993 [Pleurodeles waltl]
MLKEEEVEAFSVALGQTFSIQLPENPPFMQHHSQCRQHLEAARTTIAGPLPPKLPVPMLCAARAGAAGPSDGMPQGPALRTADTP